VFEALIDDLRQVLRLHSEHPASLSAILLDTGTPESRHWAGYDGAKSSKVHVAVEMLGHLLAAVITPAN
jgi:hypothetical protein